MPYLSHDWENGAREKVSDRLNTVLKVTSLVMFAGGVVVLWIAPLLFHFAFAGRYDQGLTVMPWTLTYCVWYSLLLVAQNYLWCAEKARFAVLPLVVGLLLNVGIDIALIPTWGLLGAVVATTAATALATSITYWINHRAGMRLEPGMILLSVAPAALCGGAWCGAAVLLAVIPALLYSKTLITTDERQLIGQLAHQYMNKLSGYWSRPNKVAEPSHAV
jgi:O-antigen/teichoic acid export membrane protein